MLAIGPYFLILSLLYRLICFYFTKHFTLSLNFTPWHISFNISKKEIIYTCPFTCLTFLLFNKKTPPFLEGTDCWQGDKIQKEAFHSKEIYRNSKWNNPPVNHTVWALASLRFTGLQALEFLNFCSWISSFRFIFYYIFFKYLQKKNPSKRFLVFL